MFELETYEIPHDRTASCAKQVSTSVFGWVSDILSAVHVPCKSLPDPGPCA